MSKNQTAAPAADVEGLTDERITEISRAYRTASGLLLQDLSFARAIEREVLATKAVEAVRPTDAVLATWPQRIYLQWNPDEREDYPGLGEDLTWCSHLIHKSDVEYVRADLAMGSAPQAADRPFKRGLALLCDLLPAEFMWGAGLQASTLDLILDRYDALSAQADEQSSMAGTARQGGTTCTESVAAPVAQEGEQGSVQARLFQQRVQPWMMACFGAEISADCAERNHRFFEEAAELTQACGMSASEAHQLVDYVWGRPIGEKYQEVGGVMVTLAALCLAQGLDMHQCGETELARIWAKVEQIRAKQAAKPKHSPLPITPAASSQSMDTPVLREILHDLCALWIGDNSEPKARLIAHIESLIAARVAGVRKDAEVWQPIESAPKDGRMLRLLVNFEDNATEDSPDPCPTIGANNFDHDGIDQWKFAGWNWSHDCFTEGKGTPVGWLPMTDAAMASHSPATPADDSVRKDAELDIGLLRLTVEQLKTRLAAAETYAEGVRKDALEEAATECEREKWYPGGKQAAQAHNNVWEAAKAIRALTHSPATSSKEGGAA